MKFIKFCLITLNIISLTKNVKSQDLNNLCGIVRVQSEIWANEKINGSVRFVRSELWSEYNDNVINDSRPFPDTVWVISRLMLPVDWMGEKLPKDTLFFINISLQLKYGDHDDCIDVINPNLTKEYYIMNNKLSYQAIEKSMRLNGRIDLKSNPVLLRKYMIENNIGFLDNNEQKKYLCQIIIKTYLGYNVDAKDCQIEHIHPVCAPVPQYYIINEW